MVVGSLEVLRDVSEDAGLNTKLKGREGTSLYVLESPDEFIDRLYYSYSFKLRFYNTFQIENRFVWINRDAHLKCFCKRWPRDKVFLGEWPDEFSWKILRKEMREEFARTYVVRREWYLEVREALMQREMMVLPAELSLVACCIRS